MTEQRWTIRKGRSRNGLRVMVRDIEGPDTEPIEVVPASELKQANAAYELLTASVLNDHETRHAEKQEVRTLREQVGDRDALLRELVEAQEDGEEAGWTGMSERRFEAAYAAAKAALASPPQERECPECKGSGILRFA